MKRKTKKPKPLLIEVSNWPNGATALEAKWIRTNLVPQSDFNTYQHDLLVRLIDQLSTQVNGLLKQGATSVHIRWALSDPKRACICTQAKRHSYD